MGCASSSLSWEEALLVFLGKHITDCIADASLELPESGPSVDTVSGSELCFYAEVSARAGSWGRSMNMVHISLLVLERSFLTFSLHTSWRQGPGVP